MRRLRSCVVLFAFLASACDSTNKTPEAAPAAKTTAVETAPAPSAPASSAPSSSSAAPSTDCAKLAPEMPEMLMVGDDPPVPPLEDATGEPDAAMAPLYERLAQLLRGKSSDHVRIGVYGDSNGTMDYMTGEMRRVLQTKYGDAGHGFVAVGRPWNWYQHRYVKHVLLKDTWESTTVTTKPNFENFYGHAMIAAQSLQGGATAFFGTVENAPIGGAVSHFEVYFLKWWRGGTFDIKVDGEVKATVDTESKEAAAGFHRLDVPDGPHQFALVAKSSPRPVRLFGVTLERDKPSIQVDGMGVGSLNCLTMLRDNPEITRATLQRRKYDLLVFHTGTNTFFGDLPACMKKVIDRHRDALPNVPVLIMTPADRLTAHHKPYKTDPELLKTIADLRKSALENRAAFFDFREAMGGDGSMGRFHELDMAGDWEHFDEKGGKYMGDRVVQAIWKGFASWLEKHPRAGCDSR